MKTLLLLLIILCSLSIIKAQDTLTILTFNDTHSTLAPIGPRDPGTLQGSQGGIARAAAIIGLTKMEDPEALVLHAGDLFMGDLFFNKFFGVAEFQLLNALGLDAMTVGNHEYDLEPSTLLQSLQLSFNPEDGFPLLSANSIIPDTGSAAPLKDYISSYTIKQAGNLKVGIFGMTTPEANLLSLPSPVFIDTNIVEIAADMVDTLEAQNCDIIIMLSHLGEVFDGIIADYVPGIDIIASGHDHFLTEAFTKTTIDGPVTFQAKSNYLYAGKLKVIYDAGQITFAEFTPIPLDNSIPEESTVKAQVEALITEIEEVWGPVYTHQTGTAAAYFEEVSDFFNSPAHDTPIGNLVTDAFIWKTGSQISIEAGGSTAQPIYEGPIVGADVFRVFGYGYNLINGLGFRLVKFTINGLGLLMGTEYALSNIIVTDEFLLQTSGMSYEWRYDLTPRLQFIKVGENFIDPVGNYTVTTNEFLYSILLQLAANYPEIQITLDTLYEDLTEFQVLAEYIQTYSPISPYINGHITPIEDKCASVLPYEFELKQNYPNPFNPATTFEFSISSSEKVSLRIYNILGSEAAVVVNENLPAGSYKYTWNASGLPSGVYIYRLDAGNRSFTKKLVLLK